MASHTFGVETPSPSLIRVLRVDGSLADLSAQDFLFEATPAALALAYVSPHLDFWDVSASLRRMAGMTPVVAVSTAGELYHCNDSDPLYCSTDAEEASVVLQIFSSDLLHDVSIHSIPLHNRDIRYGETPLPHDTRIARIAESLAAISLPFRLDARDSVALTFVDGLSACENYFVEAVYQLGHFPCLFVGGSAGNFLKATSTYIHDGKHVIENHAVVVFIKLAPGKRYGIFKSQNFYKTEKSVVVVEANPDQRTVRSVLGYGGEVIPAIEGLSYILETTPSNLASAIPGYAFGVELDGEIFIRSISNINHDNGVMSFYCDVRPGDELFLLKASDFVDQTRKDLEIFLQGKPKPIGAILNDCIERRGNNSLQLLASASIWDFPVAGFSTFGELLGININQTLTSIFFFECQEGEDFRDDIIDNFPIYYSKFKNYFTCSRLNQIKNLNRLRSGIITRLMSHLSASDRIEEILAQVIDFWSVMEGIKNTLMEEGCSGSVDLLHAVDMNDNALAAKMADLGRTVEKLRVMTASASGTGGAPLEQIRMMVGDIETVVAAMTKTFAAARQRDAAGMARYRETFTQIADVFVKSGIIDSTLSSLSNMLTEQRVTLENVTCDVESLKRFE